MAGAPSYAATPRCGIGQVSVANANRDGTGTIANIFSAGASGSRIDMIEVQAIVTTTAGMIRLFIHDGVNARLLKEIPVTAVTPSANMPAFSCTFASQSGNIAGAAILPLVLPSGYSLRASTNNAETFNIIVGGGDF